MYFSQFFPLVYSKKNFFFEKYEKIVIFERTKKIFFLRSIFLYFLEKKIFWKIFQKVGISSELTSRMLQIFLNLWESGFWDASLTPRFFEVKNEFFSQKTRAWRENLDAVSWSVCFFLLANFFVWFSKQVRVHFNE